MKKIIIGILAATLVVAGSIFVIAQRSGGKDGHFFGGKGHRAGMGRFLRGLDLSDAQKASVKEITATSRTNNAPVMEQMKQNRTELQNATKGGAFDQAQVESIAAKQGNLMAQMIVDREKTKAQIFAILTDEQKAKSAEMRTKFEERMKARKDRHQKPKSQD